MTIVDLFDLCKMFDLVGYILVYILVDYILVDYNLDFDYILDFDYMLVVAPLAHRF